MSSLDQRVVDRVVKQARELGVEIPPEILTLQGQLEHGTGGDIDQADPCLPASDAELQTRSSRCGDCAYLRSSKERADKLTEEELLDLPLRGERFWCHDGMRGPVAYRHPTLGDVPASPDDWQPPIVDGVPFRADGQAGLLCAGWAARRTLA